MKSISKNFVFVLAALTVTASSANAADKKSILGENNMDYFCQDLNVKPNGLQNELAQTATGAYRNLVAEYGGESRLSSQERTLAYPQQVREGLKQNEETLVAQRIAGK